MYVCVYVCMPIKWEWKTVRVEEWEKREGGGRGCANLKTNRESDEEWEGVPLVKYYEFCTEVIWFQWKGQPHFL